MSKSDLEELLAGQIRILNLEEPVREYRFRGVSGKRRWRFDFAWPKYHLACEVEGGIWVGGGHTRGSGFTRNVEKYNAATMLGWRVLRATSNMVRDGRAVTLIEEALESWGR